MASYTLYSPWRWYTSKLLVRSGSLIVITAMYAASTTAMLPDLKSFSESRISLKPLQLRALALDWVKSKWDPFLGGVQKSRCIPRLGFAPLASFASPGSAAATDTNFRATLCYAKARMSWSDDSR